LIEIGNSANEILACSYLDGPAEGEVEMTFLSLMFVSEKKESWPVDTDRESDVKDS